MNTQHHIKIENSLRHGKACILLLSITLLFNTAHAGGEGRDRGARSSALGGSIVSIPDDAWAGAWNPALLAWLPTGGSIVWTPSRYGLRELESSGIVWAQHVAGAGAMFAISNFGSSLYRETTPALSFGMEVDGGVALGVRAALLCISIERYGSTSLPQVDVGMAIALHEGVSFGALVSNISHTSISATVRDRLPLVVSTGISWNLDSLALFTVEVEKDVRWPFTVRTGVEYKPVDVLVFRIGATVEPFTSSFGIGIRHAGFVVDVSYRHHPDLGGTQYLGIGFQP